MAGWSGTYVHPLRDEMAQTTLKEFGLAGLSYDDQAKRMGELITQGVIVGYSMGGGGAISCEVTLNKDCSVQSNSGEVFTCHAQSMDVCIASALGAATRERIRIRV